MSANDLKGLSALVKIRLTGQLESFRRRDIPSVTSVNFTVRAQAWSSCWYISYVPMAGALLAAQRKYRGEPTGCGTAWTIHAVRLITLLLTRKAYADVATLSYSNGSKHVLLFEIMLVLASC
jgi:hypothetical protein